MDRAQIRSNISVCIPPPPCYSPRWQNFALDRMWESSVHVVMRYWTKASQWADAAQIIVPIQTVGIREECEYRTFHLEYTRDNLSSVRVPVCTG